MRAQLQQLVLVACRSYESVEAATLVHHVWRKNNLIKCSSSHCKQYPRWSRQENPTHPSSLTYLFPHKLLLIFSLSAVLQYVESSDAANVRSRSANWSASAWMLCGRVCLFWGLLLSNVGVGPVHASSDVVHLTFTAGESVELYGTLQLSSLPPTKKNPASGTAFTISNDTSIYLSIFNTCFFQSSQSLGSAGACMNKCVEKKNWPN